MFFCRTRGSRRALRKAQKQQKQAMKEAVAAGWRQYDGEGESSSEDEGGEENETDDNSLVNDMMGVIPATEAPQFQPNKQRRKSNNNDNKTPEKSCNIQVKSFNSLQLFSPEYFKDAGFQHGVSTSNSSENDAVEIDEDETSHTSQIDDDESVDGGTALENREELHALLQDIRVTAPPAPKTTATADNFVPLRENDDESACDSEGEDMDSHTEDDAEIAISQSHVIGSFANAEEDDDAGEDTYEQEERLRNNDNAISDDESSDGGSGGYLMDLLEDTEYTAETADPTETETDGGSPNSSRVLPGQPTTTATTDDVSSDDSDDYVEEDDSCGDDDGDDDSLDLGGVSASIWPSQRSSAANVAPENTAMNISEISSMSQAFVSPLGMKSPAPLISSTDILAENGHGETDDDTLDGEEKPEGAEVFLRAEGIRYTGKVDGSPHRLYGPQETIKTNSYQKFEAVPSEAQDPNVINQLLGVAERQFPHQEESRQDIQFQPRLDDDDDSEMWAQLNSTAPSQLMKLNRSGSTKSLGDLSFGSNEDTETPTKRMSNRRGRSMAPLSAMVHPMNLQLFAANDILRRSSNTSLSSQNSPGDGSVLSCPVQRERTSLFQSDQFQICSPDLQNRRSNMSSSFRSSMAPNRVSYSLTAGKKSMTKDQRLRSKNFLPNRPMLSIADKPPSSRKVRDRSLSILLVEVSQRIFEVVSIDIHHDTTIGDVLAKARSAATDPSLSEQKYTSISYRQQEFGAPMLPMNVVIDWEKHKTRPLAIAVPIGSTAKEMQAVQRVLWKNPKTKRWWKQDDPFSPCEKPLKSKETENNDNNNEDRTLDTVDEEEKQQQQPVTVSDIAIPLMDQVRLEV